MRQRFTIGVCMCAIVWAAAQAFAATGALCPTTVNGVTDVVTCVGPCTAPGGQQGSCVVSSFPANIYNSWGMPVYKWDATQSKWVPDNSFTTGNVNKCSCKIQIGVDEGGNPVFAYVTNPCCDVASDPTKPGKVVKWGTCEHPSCMPTKPNCTITGPRTAAEADCVP
jgi:hypothetical protein